jgi:hypothetical protein
MVMHLLVWLHEWLRMISFIGGAACGLYFLYVAKVHFGIDIFPAWGLHIPGPRTLAKIIARRLGLLLSTMNSGARSRFFNSPDKLSRASVAIGCSHATESNNPPQEILRHRRGSSESRFLGQKSRFEKIISSSKKILPMDPKAVAKR